MRRTLIGLEQNKSYAVQARTVLDGKASEWSPIFTFVALKDLVAPNPVTSLNAGYSSGNFTFTWVAPTLNTDGTALSDFSNYKITISSSGSGATRDYYTTTERLDLTAAQAISIFGNSIPTITATVYVVDTGGNVSTGVAVTISKPKPKPVTSLTWAVAGTGFAGTWVAPTQDTNNVTLNNLKDYEVTVNAGVYNVVYYVTSTRFDLSLAQIKAAFVTPGYFTNPPPTISIDVRARDSYNDTSTAVSLSATNPIPTVPTGFTATAGTDSVSLKWNAVADDDLVGYRVYVNTSGSTFAGATQVWQGLATSYQHNTVVYSSDHYFFVTAVDAYAQINATTALGPYRPTSPFVADATPPAAVAGATLSAPPAGSFPGATLTWTRNTETDVDFYSIRYSSASSTGPWNTITVPQETTGTTMSIVQRLPAPGSYYFQIKAQDFSGNKQASWANFSTFPYTVTGNTTAPAAPTSVVSYDGFNSLTIGWTENSESDVKWGAGTYEVQVDGYASAATTPTWLTSNTNYKAIIVGAPGATISGLAPNLYYNIRVRAINSSGTVGAWSTVIQNNLGSPIDDVPSFSIPADKFATNLLVTSNITLNTDVPNGRLGVIQSSDYNSSTGVGFKLSATGLDIQSGTIFARALQIQESANIIPSYYADFEFRSDFYSSRLLVSGTGASAGVVTASASFSGTQMLRVISGSASAVCNLAASGSDYNIKLETSQTYIVSMYVFNNSGSAQTISLDLVGNNFVNYNGTASAVHDASFARRITTTITVGASTVAAYLRITQPAGLTLYYDGIQIEKKVGGLVNTASQWKPPGSTSIDGATIRTGAIQSSTTTSTYDGAATPQPLWSIDVGGGLVVNDALVRGKLIVGLYSGGGATNITTAAQTVPSTSFANVGIFSGTYGASGQPQWAIKGDGNFELKSATGTGLNVSPTGIQAKDNTGALMFDLASSGSLVLNGNLTVAGTTTLQSTLTIVSAGKIIMTGLDANSGTASTVQLDNTGMIMTNGYNIQVARFNNGAFQIGNVLRGFSPGVLFSDAYGLESWVRNPQNPSGLPFDYNDNTTWPVRAFWLDPATGEVSMTGNITADTFTAGTGSVPFYSTTFSDGTTGATYAAWQIVQMPTTGWNSLIQADATNGSGGKVLQLTKTGSYSDGWILTGPSNDSDLTNGEIYGVWKATVECSFVTTYHLGMARMVGTSTSGLQPTSGYFLSREYNGTAYAWVINKMVGGTKTIIATLPTGTNLAPATFTANTWYKFRLRVQGSVISAKVWLSAGAEPTAWAKSITDNDVKDSGWWGVGMNSYNSATYPEPRTASYAYYAISALSSAFSVDSVGNVLVGGESTTLAPFTVSPAGVLKAEGGVTSSVNMRTKIGRVDTVGESTTNSAYVNLTTPGPDVTFVAPPSGQVSVHYSTWISNNASTTNVGVCSPQLYLGSVTGSVVYAANDAYAATASNATSSTAAASFILYGGLTPGATYTVRLLYRSNTSGVQAFFSRRKVMVIPSM